MRVLCVLALAACGGPAESRPPDAAIARHLLQLRIFGNGTAIRDDTGQRCRGGCDLAADDTLELTAAPDDGWLFDGWTGVCRSSDVHIRVQLEGVLSCDLHFVPAPPDAPDVDAEPVDAGAD